MTANRKRSLRRTAPRASARSPFTIALLSVLAVATSCATLGIGGVTLISVEEEWEMGRQLEAEIAEEMPISDDQTLIRPVTQIGERIVAQSDKADLEWRFHVVEDESVNAFNVPGGLVYVHSGLIAEADDEDELAAVIAHEVGHGAARHGAERLSQQYEMALLAQVVLGEDPGLVQQIAAEIAAAGTLARHSRSQEFEADELGVEYLHAAGYDPEGMLRFFERLLELQEREPGAVERFFATHPDLEDRIEAIEEQIQELRAGVQAPR